MCPTGAPGHNAAKAILSDRRWRRLRRPSGTSFRPTWVRGNSALSTFPSEKPDQMPVAVFRRSLMFATIRAKRWGKSWGRHGAAGSSTLGKVRGDPLETWSPFRWKRALSDGGPERREALAFPLPLGRQAQRDGLGRALNHTADPGE